MQKEQAARALAHLAHNAADRDSIATAGGVSLLVHLLDEGATDGQKEHALRALANLACTEANREAIASAGGILPLMRLLCNGRLQRHRELAMSALSKLLAHLVALLGDNLTPEEKHNAALSLAMLARTDHGSRHLSARIVAAGGIEPLVALLSEGTVQQQEYAACTLSLLASEHCNRISDQGIKLLIERLVELLGNTGEDLLYSSWKYARGLRSRSMQATVGLASLAQNEADHRRIETAGGVRVLVLQLTHGSQQLQQAAADALHAIFQTLQTEVTSAMRDAFPDARIDSLGVIELKRLLHVGGLSKSGRKSEFQYVLKNWLCAEHITRAVNAARGGDENALREIHTVTGNLSMTGYVMQGSTLAHVAAQHGHDNCLRVLHELGASKSLCATNGQGLTPAHVAAQYGHGNCLRVLDELGASKSLYAAPAEGLTMGLTPAHVAAQWGRVACLEALHERLASTLNGQLESLRAIDAVDVSGPIRELEAKLSLRWSSSDIKSPAQIAARKGQSCPSPSDKKFKRCFRYLVKIGGATEFWKHLEEHPETIDRDYPWLLKAPQLLDLRCKRAWLSFRLDAVVQRASADVLLLTAKRFDILEGLCAHLGVEERTGSIIGEAALPVGVDVEFEDEPSSGDGLRRDWFELVVAEMLSLDHGLFITKPNGLQPNPHSALAEPGHLAYFALLGRVVGLALYHREPLNASWTALFLKAAFGYKITMEDIRMEGPGNEGEDFYKRLMETLRYTPEMFEHLCLFFYVDEEVTPQNEYMGTRRRRVALMSGGEDIPVTAENVGEYIELYSEYKLGVHQFKEQADAFRGGLGVFFDHELLKTLRRCCTVYDVDLLLCGIPEIDVDDWMSHTNYEPQEFGSSYQVEWLWSLVESMSNEERSKLLKFCTNSARPPATGFAYLSPSFKICCNDSRGNHRPLPLPTAATCFRTLYLPPYDTEDELRAKVWTAITESQGHDENAVADH